MDISVVVLTYNEEKNIKDCLESVLKQEQADGNWEILVVDGNSNDKTLEIIKNLQKISDRIRLVANDKKQIAAGRNLGIRASRYPFIAFTDADCVVPKDWLKKLAAEYQRLSLVDQSIAGVGGGNVPFDNGSRFGQALGVYLDSFLGSFNSVQGRNFTEVKKVASLACLNVLYKKNSLIECDSFDEKLGNIGEDADLNLRLRKKGYNLFFIPNLAVAHKLRPTLSGWLRNMALYGQGRAIVSCKHKDYFRLFFVLPFLFVLGMLMLPLGFLHPIFFISLLYFPAIFLYASIVALKRNKISLLPVTLAIFISTHYVYSFALFIKFGQAQFSPRGLFQ
ncbi:glycosyltransferase [Candidatus Margulisiibacteriota bacterium]